MRRHTLRSWMVRAAAAAALAGVVGAPAAARADEVDTLGGKVVELDARVGELNGQLKPPAEPGPELAERRLIDAQVLYELKNYEAASIILFDVVEKFAQSPAYPEALFYLADSLYLKRDFLSSRRYFEKVIELGAEKPRYAEALQRLIELSLHTGDYTPVDGYIAKLEGVNIQKPLPTVPYVEGKYFYFRQQWDKALKILGTIGTEHPYYLHAQYFTGAANVAQGVDHYDAAINAFSIITKTAAAAADAQKKDPKAKGLTDAQKSIVELAHMALGRLFLERAQLVQAFDEYAQIPQKSDQFNDALYESAWVAIKSKDYGRARRQLDLLLLNAPDSSFAPEVKLLLGSLHIRQNEFGPATDSFTKTRDEFEPIHKQLEAELQKPSSTPGYFKDLISKNLVKFDMAAILPQGAGRWVKEEADVQRVSTLINDEADLKKSLDESEEIVKRLEKALSGPARVNVFPDLANMRAKVTELSNELTEAKRKLGAREGQLIAPVGGDKKAELDALTAEREKLEAQLAVIPGKAAAMQEQQTKARNQLNELDKRANELSVELTNLKKSVDAIRKVREDALKHKDDAPAQAGTTPPPSADPGMPAGYGERQQLLGKKLDDGKTSVGKLKERVDRLKDAVLQRPAETKAELDAVTAEVENEQAAVEQVRRDILEAAGSIGVDDAAMQEGARLRAQYEDLLKRQHAVVVDVQARLSGGDRTKVQQIESILDRARAVDVKIAAFNGRIDEILDAKLKDIQVALAEEKAHVAEYQQKLGGYQGESADVGGAVVADSFKAVERRFYNIVVRSDVGIIDVAWALKDSATRESNRLVAERKRELKLLDDEFKEVLKEQP